MIPDFKQMSWTMSAEGAEQTGLGRRKDLERPELKQSVSDREWKEAPHLSLKVSSQGFKLKQVLTKIEIVLYPSSTSAAQTHTRTHTHTQLNRMHVQDTVNENQ